jgi:tryptophan synthase alpha chain
MTLSEATRSLKSRGEKALVPFFTAGYPDEETFLKLLGTASESGCQVIEIGVPFSDPIADGPAIQESSKRALENGMSLSRALDLARMAREGNGSDFPELILMGYVNPVLRFGVERFAESARRSGVSGAIIPDVPFEESNQVRRGLMKHGMAFVDLIAPTTGVDRMRSIARGAEGFLYLVSVTGVTGASSCAPEFLEEFAGRVRRETKIPLYVGFGISSPEEAGRAARFCDGVIIGSALVRLVQSSKSNMEAVDRVRVFLEKAKQEIAAQPEMKS